MLCQKTQTVRPSTPFSCFYVSRNIRNSKARGINQFRELSVSMMAAIPIRVRRVNGVT